MEMLKFICAIPVIVLLCFMKFNVLGCDGFEKCCVGYTWNVFLQNCTKCRIGYTGINCEEQCPYPTYGEICQKECNCDSTLCDFSTGCKPNRTLVTNATMTSSMKEVLYYIGTTNLNTYSEKSSNKHHTEPYNFSQLKENNVLFHPLVLSLFSFNVIFIIIILIFIFIFSRTLYCKPIPSGICTKEAKQKIRKKQRSYEGNTENESEDCLLHSAFTSVADTSNGFISKTNNQYDSRNPSENSEYTDTKSAYTEMTAVSLSNRGESLQLLRQPCQSVDDHVYSATDTLRFESETDTKEFLNE